ncbi:heat shock transcription factor, Y-linked-like [Pelobates fuscus]|uniref:heat shock transcription factor, Y-linked-like n=1 Tax=Pelobates fuscus TaxID=191477 RepID=UPI002FE46E4A
MKGFLSMNFPRKLWQIVESEYFKSISWDEHGTSVVINEDLFKAEVLERKMPFKIFETDSIKSFIRQLNLYGFVKVRHNIERSASLAEFLAEERSATAFHKMQFYHNPNFRRDEPHLLGRMKRRIGIKNSITATSLLEPGVDNEAPKNVEKACKQTSVLEEDARRFYSKSPNVNQRPFLPMHHGPSTSSASSVRPLESGVDQHFDFSQLPPFDSQNISSNHNNTYGIGSTTMASSSLLQVLPPMQSNHFNPAMGFPGFPSMYQDLAAQANLVSLLPFFNPWLSVPMIAAASAAYMTHSFYHSSSSSSNHCPNCNCFNGAHQHVPKKA